MAGGYEFPEPYAELTMRTDSFAYSMASGQWRELAPLEIPGYDGVIRAAGTWTGSAWEGLAFPCPSGPVPDELIYDTCAKSVVGLRWDPSTGWSTSAASPAPDDLGRGLHFAGVTSSSEIIITAPLGFFTRPLVLGVDVGWIYTPWPPEAAPIMGDAACLVGDQLLTLPTPASVSVLSLADLGATDRTLAESASTSEPQAFCRPGEALFVQTGFEQPILRVLGRETSSLPTPTAIGDANTYVSVSSELVDVGSGLVSLGIDSSWFLNPETGELTPLSNGPSMMVSSTVWTGDSLIGSPVSKDQNRWFAFTPMNGSWPDSEALAFPEPLPLPVN